MEKILAVVTKEKEYAERFCAYINRKKNIVLTAVPFENMELCNNFSENHNVKLILTDSNMAENNYYVNGSIATMGQAPKTLLLGDDGDENHINKYQSAEEIMRKIMNRCEDIEIRKKMDSIGRPVKIIGIYTPVSGTEKTAFALTLSKMLSRMKNTLYINFEEFSGFSRITGEDYTTSLTDAVYYMKQGKLSYEKLTGLIYTFSGIDHIPPLKNATDLNAISGEDYTNLMTEIFKQSEYDVIVAEMSSFAEIASNILDECETIFMPVKEDFISMSKVEEFDELMRTSGREDVLKNIVKIRLPREEQFNNRETFIDNLLFGEMGDLVREIYEIVR